MSYRRFAFVSLLVSVMLAGCNRDYVPPEEPGSEAPSSPTTTTEPAPVPPQPVPLPQRAFPIPPMKPSLEAGETGAPRPSPVVDPDDPQRLVGLDLPEATELLGEPSIAEEQPPGKILTYVWEACRLKVFFYPDLSDQHFKALTYEFSGIEASAEAERACFATMLQRNGI